jgi:hypothetical protein
MLLTPIYPEEPISKISTLNKLEIKNDFHKISENKTIQKLLIRLWSVNLNIQVLKLHCKVNVSQTLVFDCVSLGRY